MFRSIRWRLPLSYAAVALLAALALGAVLLPTLLSYYARQETNYMLGNAKAVGAVVTSMLENGQPAEAVQAQIGFYAVLSQSQVQVWDAQGQLLAKADAPKKAQVVSVVKRAVNVKGAVAVAPGPGAQAVTRAAPEPDDATGQAPADQQPASQPMFFIAQASGSTAAVPSPAGTTPDLPPDIVSSIPVVATRLGIGFDPAVAWSGQRSSRVVVQPVTSSDGQLLGTVRLSNGPAYGLDIVASVARGWAIASAVAVLLAALAGWLISRTVSRPVLALSAVTARMADGDLSARADMKRKDEFGQLAGSFNQMASRVEGTVTALRRFVADAAHELHTPLTALHTDLELAASEPDAAAQRDLIERAQAQLARLEGLTTSLLDLSRLEASAAQGEHALLDLAALVRQASEPYASRAEQAGLSFSLSLPEQPVTVRGDAGQLARALGNLLDNACKFTPQGGKVTLGLCTDGGWAEVMVEDTGIGIPAADLEHLFSRFHRASNAAGYPGNGLGLAIVRAIVEAHGGEVRAESLAPGVRLTLRLPVA